MDGLVRIPLGVIGRSGNVVALLIRTQRVETIEVAACFLLPIRRRRKIVECLTDEPH